MGKHEKLDPNTAKCPDTRELGLPHQMITRTIGAITEDHCHWCDHSSDEIAWTLQQERPPPRLMPPLA